MLSGLTPFLWIALQALDMVLCMRAAICAHVHSFLRSSVRPNMNAPLMSVCVLSVKYPCWPPLLGIFCTLSYASHCALFRLPTRSRTLARHCCLYSSLKGAVCLQLHHSVNLQLWPACSCPMQANKYILQKGTLANVNCVRRSASIWANGADASRHAPVCIRLESPDCPHSSLVSFCPASQLVTGSCLMPDGHCQHHERCSIRASRQQH